MNSSETDSIQLALGENCGTLVIVIETYQWARFLWYFDKDLHMATEGNFKVRQSSFGVRITQSSDTVNNEAIILDRGLEALLAIP